MKGKMDVLNLKKRFSSQNQIVKNCSPKPAAFNLVKAEFDKISEKEYSCENTDSVINNEPSYNKKKQNISEQIEASNEFPEVPIVSVDIKEEIPDCDEQEDPLKLHGSGSVEDISDRLEIKYEDDIEEEEYDSDEDCYEHFLEPELQKSNNFSKNNEKTSMNGKNLVYNQTDDSPLHSCFNAAYFESSILNFQIGSHIEKHNAREITNAGLNDNQLNNNKIADKSSDSILLSIVYATINVPFSQVSKFLTAYNLSKSQLMVIRKVRRQVKNRLYAQNCRKRRVAHIKNLANELKQLRTQKRKLCIVRENLTSEMANLETCYKRLHAHVINALTEKYRNRHFLFTDSNMNLPDSPDEIRIQKRKLIEERELMELKKRKLENQFDKLYQHVFQVIKTRHHTNGLNRNGDNCIDFKLCNMDIVNELALLNEHWSKNNNTKLNETVDLDSSISIDDSRTSENKLNDFIDYESSISIDGSETEENKLNDDFTEYESNVDERVPSGHDDDSINANSLDHDSAITNLLNYDSRNVNSLDHGSVHANLLNNDLAHSNSPDRDSVRADSPDRDSVHANSLDHDSVQANSIYGDTRNESTIIDENSKMSEDSLMVCSDYEGEEEEEEESEDENDDEMFDLTELHSEKEALQIKKYDLKKQYDKLYIHVFEALQMSEIDFLKMYLDYCLQLLKIPGRDLSSIAFDNS